MKKNALLEAGPCSVANNFAEQYIWPTTYYANIVYDTGSSVSATQYLYNGQTPVGNPVLNVKGTITSLGSGTLTLSGSWFLSYGAENATGTSVIAGSGTGASSTSSGTGTSVTSGSGTSGGTSTGTGTSTTSGSGTSGGTSSGTGTSATSGSGTSGGTSSGTGTSTTSGSGTSGAPLKQNHPVVLPVNVSKPVASPASQPKISKPVVINHSRPAVQYMGTPYASGPQYLPTNNIKPVVISGSAKSIPTTNIKSNTVITPNSANAAECTVGKSGRLVCVTITSK